MCPESALPTLLLSVRFFVAAMSVLALCCCISVHFFRRRCYSRRVSRLTTSTSRRVRLADSLGGVPAEVLASLPVVVFAPTSTSTSIPTAIPVAAASATPVSAKLACAALDGECDDSSALALQAASLFDTCVVCMSDFVAGERLLVLPCRHRFHKACIAPWLSSHTVREPRGLLCGVAEWSCVEWSGVEWAGEEGVCDGWDQVARVMRAACASLSCRHVRRARRP